MSSLPNLSLSIHNRRSNGSVIKERTNLRNFLPRLGLKMANHEEIDFWKWAETTRSLGIAWIEPSLIIGHCNHQFASIIGRDRYDCISSEIGIIYPPETRNQITYSLKRMIEGLSEEEFQVRQSILITPTGRRIYAKVEDVLCKDMNEEIRGIIKVIQELPSGNFSKIEQIEADLKALKEETSFIHGKGVQVFMSQDHKGDDYSQDRSNKADRNSMISLNDNKTMKAIIVALIVVLGIVVLGFIALVVGGQINLNGGGGVNINP